ncbi:unnamed protein product [Durusdinium trenchii]|uniref:WW domain-containing protein n=2 Tax=Durusdinium trenchii TaxID=1381693 RepID=A0ABP0J0G4_9DINO
MRLPPNWQLLRTNDGRNYFWNPETNQTTWRFPQEDVGAPHPLQKPVSTFRGYTEVPPFRPKERRFSVDGRCFLVECMPADHSCGFHGIGVDRETASSLLFANLHDPEVEEFLARDLLAALQTGNRSSFPVQLRERPELWEMLDKVYDKQKALDHQRREAKAFIRDAGASSPVQVQAEESVETAIRSCFQELKAKVRQQPSSLKLFTLQLLAQCKSHERDVDHANEASKKALREVLEVCKKHVAAYVAWVRSDSTFWLSFLRAPEGDRGGGLLDAVAKVACLTVRVWGEGTKI